MSSKRRDVARSGQNAPSRGGQFAAIQTTYSGPLPPPEDLERYDLIVPGMADRLLTKFEQQTDHRMALETKVVNGDVRRANAGLVAATIFGLAVLVAATILILNGHEGAGVTTIIGAFLTYGTAFLYGSETRRRERNRKSGQ